MNDPHLMRHDSFSFHLVPAGKDMVYLTAAVSDPREDAGTVSLAIYQRVVEALKQQSLQILHERAFGSLEVQAAVLKARQETMSGNECHPPLTYIQGQPLWGHGFAGLQIQAIHPATGDAVRTILDDGAPCGRTWSRGGVTYLVLQNLHGLSRNSASRESATGQAERMFERAHRILRSLDATYLDVARTWIYLDKILDWYGPFNAVRNTFYQQFGLLSAPPGLTLRRQTPPPASTGIEGNNPWHAACVMDLLAVTGKPGGRPPIARMSNVRQKDAFCYGAAFSRGVCLSEADVTHIQISGTAAIDEHGESLFPDDPRAQIQRTLDNIEALITPLGSGLKDLCSATVFLKRPKDAPLFQQMASERGLSDLPAVCVRADICRPELLFEMDAVGALSRGPASRDRHVGSRLGCP